MAMAEIIKSKLEAALAPQVLDIDDQSERHRGHAGYREGGESHFHLTIVSDAFAGKAVSIASAWSTAPWPKN